MRLLIYSDVHGNLPAFEAMLKHVGNCDAYISLGDLVNYGPWSNECVELACSLPNSVLLMGNHEEAFINGSYPGNNDLVKLFFNKTYPSFNRLKEIESFETEHQLGDFLLTHTIDDEYIYPDTTITLDRNYIIGHSHHQFSYRNNNFTLHNAGSVGQNRKFINVANYLTMDVDKRGIELGKLPFNVDLIIDKMDAEAFPEKCIQYYKNKDRI